MNFENRFAKWLQDGREFRGAFRNAIIALERKRDPDIPQADLEVKANHLMYDLLGWIPEEGDAGFSHGVRVAHKDVTAADMTKVIGRVMEGDDRPVEWGNLFGEGSIDNTIQVSARGAKLLGEYYPEGITSKLLDPRPDSVKLPIVDGAGNHVGDEVIYRTVVVEPSPAHQIKPHASLVRDPGIVGFEEDVPLKPIPSAPYERAVVASELWRELIADQDIGKTNSFTEGQFERLQEKYYGKVFLRVKINGLQVGVQHLIAPDTWVTL